MFCGINMFVVCNVICAVVLCMVAIALVNISRDLKRTTALMINGYSVVSHGGYRVTRLYEYNIDNREYVGKTTTTKEYDKETAELLSKERVGELVDIYYELENPMNIYEKSCLYLYLYQGYMFSGYALMVGVCALMMYYKSI